MEYGHGGDIYTYKGMMDFSVNVNPFGPSEQVIRAVRDSASLAGNYPDSSCRSLRQKLAEKKALPRDFFIAGNGAADLFFSLALAEKPKRALIPVPAFSEYARALHTVGCEIREYPLKREDDFRLTENFINALESDIDMVFLCDPSNPAGQTTERELVERIAEKCQKYGWMSALYSFSLIRKNIRWNSWPVNTPVCLWSRRLRKCMPYQVCVSGTGSHRTGSFWKRYRRAGSHGAYPYRLRRREPRLWRRMRE